MCGENLDGRTDLVAALPRLALASEPHSAERRFGRLRRVGMSRLDGGRTLEIRDAISPRVGTEVRGRDLYTGVICKRPLRRLGRVGPSTFREREHPPWFRFRRAASPPVHC